MNTNAQVGTANFGRCDKIHFEKLGNVYFDFEKLGMVYFHFEKLGMV